MGFSLDEYIKTNSRKNKGLDGAKSDSSSGFSLDQYLISKKDPGPDLNNWFQNQQSLTKQILDTVNSERFVYKPSNDVESYVEQSGGSIDDLIRQGLNMRNRFSENKDSYDAKYGPGTSDKVYRDISLAIRQMEGLRTGLAKEQAYRNQFQNETEFQNYLIASGDEAAAESVMSSLEQAKSANEKNLAELNKQLDEFQWGDKTVAEIISGRKAIKDQIKELEEQQKSIQDQYSRYYYTIDNRKKQAAIKEDPDANALYESANVLRSDIDKVNAIADEVLFNKGNPKVPEYKQYLNEKYGLTEEAIKNFDIGGGGFKYSENGYGNLWQLYEDLENQLNATKGQLSEKGYDYDRIIGYEQSLADAEEYRKKQEEWEQYADKNFLSGLSASISSVIMSPFQGLDYIRLWINNAGHNDVNDLENYVPLNVYDMDATNFVSTIRSTVSKNIEESTDWNLFGENVASFLYQTGMSVADSMAQVATFGSGAVFLMGASAASNQAKNVIERGGSNSQAFWGGLAAGAAEVLFEKISIDRLLKTKHVTGWKSILKDKIKQSGVEASEEMLTEIANILSDTAIMGESSDFSMAVQAYQEQGLSETEAKKKAFLDCIGQVAKAGVGGALSGLVMGGASGVIDMANRNVDTRSVGNQILRSGEIDLTIDEGLKLDSSDPLYKLAEELAERQNQGKTLSPKKVGQLEIGLETKALENRESMHSQAAYNIKISYPQIRQLYDMAAKYDTNTARAFISGFDGTLPLTSYQTAFDYFRTQAKQGIPLETAEKNGGLLGQLLAPESRRIAYSSGENLHSSETRGNMGAEHETMGGMKNVSVRQDTGSVLGRRGFQSDNGRAGSQNDAGSRRGQEGPKLGERDGRRPDGWQGIGGGVESRARNQRPGGRETAGEVYEGSRYTGERAEQQGRPGEVDKRRYTHREIQASESADAAPETISFDAVRPELYSKAQKRAVEVGKEYGKTVYYVRRGDPINIGGRIKRMKGEAFTIPGTDIVFAAHDTKADFIHHELFHQFLALNRHQEKTLYWYITALANESTSKYEWYRKKTKSSYPKYQSNVAAIRRLAMEEITCDLCEYAMSGSEKMYNRLNGLFEGDALETLAEQAREVFEANREAAPKNAAAVNARTKKGSLATATDAPASGPLSLTPETTGGTASNNSIGENPGTVNTSKPQSPEKDIGIRYSIREDEAGRYVCIDTDQDIFDGVPRREWPKVAKQYINSHFRGKALPLGEYDVAQVKTKASGEFTHPSTLVPISSNEFEAKMRASTELDNLMEVAEYAYSARDTKSHPEAVLGWDYYTVRFLLDGHEFEGLINIANGENSRQFYDITKIREVPDTSEESDASLAQLAPAFRSLSSDNVVPQNTDGANTSIPKRSKRDTGHRYYLDEGQDSEGGPLTKEPAEVRGEFSRLYAPDSGTSERLQAMAAGYDADTAEAFAAGYDGTLPLTSYQTAFDYFRTQAKQGIPLETAEKNGGLLGQLLAPESRRIAYQAGLRESAGRGNIEGEGGGRNGEIQDIRGGTGSLYGESRGSGGTEADGRGQTEVRRTREETREAFTRRAEESAQAQAGGDRRLSHLEEHGNSLIAYREKTADETTAPGRAVLWLRKNGIDAVLTDGMFESNRKGRTTRHPEAATSPDGKVFISSEATLSEAELSRHEAVHVLEMKGSPLYSDYYDELQGLLLINSEHYRALAKEINKEYYNGKLDIEDIDSVYPISRELFAYVHQFIQTDPAWASERFSGAFSDWDGVVEASRRLAQGLENQGAVGDAQGNGNPSRKEPAEVRGEFSRLYAPDSGTSERLQAMAAGYDADTAEAFAAGYDGTLPLTSYQTAFDYFRTQAKQGIPLETAEKNGGLLGQLLAPESRRIAYQAGLRESAGRGMMEESMIDRTGDTQNPLHKSTCSTDRLTQYLQKNAGEAEAAAYRQTGIWPKNIQIPKNNTVLQADGSIDWTKAPGAGYVLDSDGEPIKKAYVPKQGEILDRYWPDNGRLTCPVIDGKPFRMEENTTEQSFIVEKSPALMDGASVEEFNMNYL